MIESKWTAHDHAWRCLSWAAGVAGWLVTNMMDVAVGSTTHKHAACGQQRESCSYGN